MAVSTVISAAHRVAVFGCLALAACSDPADWYYHWNCNGDPECLTTNPTGQPSGDSDEGPEEVNCTQLMQFRVHFWGPGALDACDQSPTPGGGVTYALTYDGNGNSGGAVPVDPTHYTELQLVTVLGNPGSLVRTGHAFAGWNSKADGSGKAWTAGQHFILTTDATLYAGWTVQ